MLDDADFEKIITRDVLGVVVNSGQSCNAASRILVPSDRMNDAIAIAKAATASIVVGQPEAEGTTVGPLVSQTQFDKVQRLIQTGIEEGGTLVAGGVGRPAGLSTGYFVRPTVFADVTNDMTIAREEIFGPVMMLIGYEDEADAIRIANDTAYGLSGMVSSSDPERARNVARQLRTGMVHLNGAPLAFDAPFGGYKQSGNGREFGKFGLMEYLEAKTIFGDNDEPGPAVNSGRQSVRE